jgi:hypothetical protein
LLDRKASASARALALECWRVASAGPCGMHVRDLALSRDPLVVVARATEVMRTTLKRAYDSVFKDRGSHSGLRVGGRYGSPCPHGRQVSLLRLRNILEAEPGESALQSLPNTETEPHWLADCPGTKHQARPFFPPTSLSACGSGRSHRAATRQFWRARPFVPNCSKRFSSRCSSRDC